MYKRIWKKNPISLVVLGNRHWVEFEIPRIDDLQKYTWGGLSVTGVEMSYRFGDRGSDPGAARELVKTLTAGSYSQGSHKSPHNDDLSCPPNATTKHGAFPTFENDT